MKYNGQSPHVTSDQRRAAWFLLKCFAAVVTILLLELMGIGYLVGRYLIHW